MSAQHGLHCRSSSSLVPVFRKSSRGHSKLHADHLKCVSQSIDALLLAAEFTTHYINAAGQSAAPGECILLSTSNLARDEMTSWVFSDGAQWPVNLDVRKLGATWISPKEAVGPVQHPRCQCPLLSLQNQTAHHTYDVF